MKNIFLFFFFLFSFSLFSQERNWCSVKKSLYKNPTTINKHLSTNISDTIHITHYTIFVDTINFVSKTIRAKTQLTVQAKQSSVNNITLWLLKLQVDSIKSANQNLNFSYNDTLLRITPISPLNNGDSTIITVYYKGAPKMDASGWGGFYFSGNYAFNLGVGFEAIPHNFGRVWFPCIDEFTDRSTYDFFITTDLTRKAFCNGILQSETDNGNGTKTWHWKMNQTIPTYLVGMAVAPFYTMERTYSGIPAQFAILASDSNKTINTFANIDSCVSTFINDYGAYPWDKIGYVMTPVVYGGMENASSIHLSYAFVDGTKNYETLWAHELSHMWWGDKVTCDKAEEMWLNEGWATFNEHIFTEALYGNAAYKNSFRKDHREVLQFAHIEDGNYYAMNDVPQAYTYASLSVYVKGALMAHTLRNYMGDAKFFQACKDYMNNRAYGNANSYQMRDDFTNSSGIDMSDFFEGWIFTPGFPHFSIDSTTVMWNGMNYYVTVFTRQKQKGNNHLYKMNVEFNFTDGTNDTNIVFTIDNYINSFTATFPFEPTFISIDRNEKMMDAITDFENTITSSGTKLFPETNVSLSVLDTGAGKSIVRIEHSFVPPDYFKNNTIGVRLSDYHYWKIDGIFANNFRTKATFTYDGSTSLSTGYLDNAFITTNEDSLLILYREGTWDDWKIADSYTHNKGNTNDKKGTFVVDTLKKGEYTIGKYDYTILKNHFPISNFQLLIYPNPTNGICTIEFFTTREKPVKLAAYDISGKIIFSTLIFPHQQFIKWDTSKIPAGIYSVNVFDGEKKLYSEKVVVAK